MNSFVRTSSGFTLVELAIVMTIIGLLIGGVLKGQELMENARITATAAQVKAFTAAVTEFRDMYQATPGDMVNAQNRLVGCTVGCNPYPSVGDNIIGFPTWASGGWTPLTFTLTYGPAPAINQGGETYLFWVHLLLANLINGVTADAVNKVIPFEWGVTHPAAKIGGGFIVGYDDGTPGLGGLASNFQAAGTGMSGMIVALVPQPGTAMATTSSTQVMTPLRAAQLDRKIDDGRPATGYVQAYGVPASCWQSAALQQYLESVGTKDCGLLFRIEE